MRSTAHHRPPRDETHLIGPSSHERLRHWRSRFWTTICLACACLCLLPLASVLFYVVQKGAPGLSLSFFTELPRPPLEDGGGMGNAVLGTLTLIALACVFGLPIGILAGVYLAEVGRGKLAATIRFIADVLGGVPSVTVGVFVWSLLVVRMRHFSALAGGIALGILMLPTLTRSTEELLRLVPRHLREASLALGITEWRTTLFVVVRTALPGIVTGIMLAVARISGETAPLLFTVLNLNEFSVSLDEPIATLPVQVYKYATSPYAEWQKQAWTGALVLVVIVLVLNLTARIATRTRT